MITPRTTRLVRVPDLRAFRDAVTALACDGTPFDARDRLVVVPTRAAAAHLIRSIEHRLNRKETASPRAVALPALITPRELTLRIAERLPDPAVRLADAEREALLGVASRAAAAGGHEPPFRLRPGLIAEILRFYDALRRNQKDIDTFERLALGALEPGAAIDRGAERLVRQTRFLVAAFRHFEQLCANAGGVDEHVLRERALTTTAPRPWRHVVLTVGDRSRDLHGLTPVDWDLLARVPGLERLDVVVTNTVLAGALHERMHALLPGIEEVPYAGDPGSPTLLVPPGDGGIAHLGRDREEEVAGFARWVKQLAREGEARELDRIALVVRQPLPYVYVAREVLRAAGVPCQMFDALPLAGEPYAAALDLVFSFVDGNFARVPSIALLRSPHFRFTGGEGDAGRSAGPTLKDIAALDRALSDKSYLGEIDVLERLVPELGERAQPAGLTLLALARELAPLRTAAPVADHLTRLMAFLTAHENLPGPDDPLRQRQLRARSAILATLVSLRDAWQRFDATPVDFDVVAALVRRWIEGQTFAPRTGESGVHLVDAESAKFGDFDHVQLAGLVDGEWPDRPRRNIFYSPGLLRDLGWTPESERLDGIRAAFADLLRLPASQLVISAFTLEDDAVVAPSTMLDEAAGAGLEEREWAPDGTAIFAHELLGFEPVPVVDPKYQGRTASPPMTAFSLSALERYQDCPFKFFAADLLRLEEAPEDEPALSPRARGRFIHEVFQRFFAAWDARGAGAITPERLDEARRRLAHPTPRRSAGTPRG